jgi:hypothetical protein
MNSLKSVLPQRHFVGSFMTRRYYICADNVYVYKSIWPQRRINIQKQPHHFVTPKVGCPTDEEIRNW